MDPCAPTLVTSHPTMIARSAKVRKKQTFGAGIFQEVVGADIFQEAVEDIFQDRQKDDDSSSNVAGANNTMTKDKITMDPCLPTMIKCSAKVRIRSPLPPHRPHPSHNSVHRDSRRWRSRPRQEQHAKATLQNLKFPKAQPKIKVFPKTSW